ncbi:MAG: hypothetical protein V2A79_20275 [Planctomycetota bacterium]
MNQPDKLRPDHLLDYHLGLVDEEQATQIRCQIADSDLLRTQSRNVSAWLDLLESYPVPPPPPRLVDQIMARMATTPPLRVTEVASSLPPASRGGVFRRPVLSLRELVALAACITFFIGVVIPSVSRVRSQGRRTMCASSLNGLYAGLSQYAANFNGMMPQTAGFIPGINWLRSPQPGVARVPNSRNRYLLVRLHFVKPESFMCAARDDARRMDGGPVDRLDDFPVPENCSFDSQNMAGPTLPLGAGRCVPIYADRNPLFDGGKLNPVNPRETNSRSHDGGSGQNVLCADGQVFWSTTPVFGPQGDNIWQVEGVTTYTGTEYQQHPADAFVIP